jgi:hypothetical protein
MHGVFLTVLVRQLFKQNQPMLSGHSISPPITLAGALIEKAVSHFTFASQG